MAKTVKMWDGAQWQDVATAIAQPDVSQFATAAQGALADTAVQVVGSPSVGDVIEWDGSQWVPAAVSVGGTSYVLDNASVDATPETLDVTGMTELEVNWVGKLAADAFTAGSSWVLAGQGTLTNAWGIQATSGSNIYFYVKKPDGSSVSAGWDAPGPGNWLASVTPGATVNIRVIWRADDGTGSPDMRILVSSDGGATFTEVPVTIRGSVPIPTSLATPTGNQRFGAPLGKASLHSGSIVRNGAEAAAWNADTARGPRDADEYDNIWTIIGAAYVWKAV